MAVRPSSPLASLLAVFALAGCGTVDDPADRVDAGPSVDSGSQCAAIPSTEPSWLLGFQDEVVARLAGALEIAPGLTLTDRATASRRAATRDYLAATLSAHGLSPQFDGYGAGTNVWAELSPRVAGAPWIVLGAHFDSVSGSPGANDNATGVALVLAVARYLATLTCRDVGFVFVFFDEEELGQIGSEHFASFLLGDGRSVEAVHTVDQMGWDQDDDRAIELERPSASLFSFYEMAASAGGFFTTLIETTTGATDHVSFRARGFAAVGLTEGFVSGDTTPHYHLPSDTYATVDLAYLATTTRLVVFALASRARPSNAE